LAVKATVYRIIRDSNPGLG